MDHGDLVAIITISIWSLPLTIPFVKHARSFEQFAWLQRFFKNRLYEGLPPNFFCSHRHYKNGDYHAIWLVQVFVHAIWIVSHRTDFSEHDAPQVDGLDGVFAYMDDSRVGSPDRQTHLHLEAFFKALAANGLTYQP
jgi:hypothetical protein